MQYCEDCKFCVPFENDAIRMDLAQCKADPREIDRALLRLSKNFCPGQRYGYCTHIRTKDTCVNFVPIESVDLHTKIETNHVDTEV